MNSYQLGVAWVVSIVASASLVAQVDRQSREFPATRQAGPVLVSDEASTSDVGKARRLGFIDNHPPAAVLQVAAHRKAISSLAWAPVDGAIITGSLDSNCSSWEAEAGRKLWTISDMHRAVHTLVTSPDGRKLIIGDDGGLLRIWDPTTGRLLARGIGLGDPVWALCFLPDGKSFVSREPYCINFRSADSCELIDGGYPARNNALSITNNGRLLASGGDTAHSIAIWDVRTKKRIKVLDVKAGVVSYVAFSPDGSLLASAHVGLRDSVRIWQVSSGSEVLRIGSQREKVGQDGLAREAAERTAGVSAVAFSPDGRFLASCGRDGTVRIWDVATGIEVSRLVGHECSVSCVAYSRDGSWLASGDTRGQVFVWDMNIRCQGGRLIQRELNRVEMEQCWREVGSGRGNRRVYSSAWTLASGGETTVRFLQDRIRAPANEDSERVARLIRRLDDGDFKLREQAMRELGVFGEVARPGLRGALSGPRTVEARRRIEVLLETMRISPELGQLRFGLQILQVIDSEAAREFLRGLCRGGRGDWLAYEARRIGS